MALTQADFQRLASTGGAQAVFDAAKNAGMSLEQLAQVGGVSTQEMANLALSQGISTSQLGQIGYTSPTPAAPAPTPAPKPAPKPAAPAPGTPAIGGKTGYMDVTTGQFKYFGTPEYDAWLKGLTPGLNAIGVTPDEYLKGGVGTRLMSNPLTDAYSSAFAANNVGGGGQAWAGSVGGMLGFGKKYGFVDANGFNTGLGDVTGMTPQFRQHITSQSGNQNHASGNTPGQINKVPDQRAPSYTAPTGYGQTKPLAIQNIDNRVQGQFAPMIGAYGGMQRYGGYGRSMYPYQNYSRQGMFGGTATSRMPYTGYQAYQPYGGYGRNTGMFGAPTMNYNMRNRPMQQITPYSQMRWSQNNPWSY